MTITSIHMAKTEGLPGTGTLRRNRQRQIQSSVTMEAFKDPTESAQLGRDMSTDYCVQ